MSHKASIDLNDFIFQFPGACYWKDLELRNQGASKIMIDISGKKSLEAYEGCSDFEFPWACYADGYRSDDRQAIAGKNVITMHKVRTFKKEVVDIVSKKSSLKNKSGKIIGAIGYAFCLSPEQVKKMESLRTEDKVLFGIPSNQDYHVEKCFSGLTPRESQCFFHFLRGKTMKEIGMILNISHRTVETHLINIKLKLNVRTKSDLYDKAFELGWVNIIID